MNAKTTASELPKTTNDQKTVAAAVVTTAPVVAAASPSAAGPIKNASTPISSTPTADMTGAEGKPVIADSPAVTPEKKPKPPTKMEIASSIYLRMAKQKDITRKQIVVSGDN
jgi:hypothetical protein